MNRFVLDASIALAWCFEDESSRQADAVLALLISAEALVPPVWPLEIVNALLVAERHNRITTAGAARSLGLLQALNIRCDDSFWPDLASLLSLARTHRLAAYDATYLALSMREGIPLATLDRELDRAARRAGVSVLKP